MDSTQYWSLLKYFHTTLAYPLPHRLRLESSNIQIVVISTRLARLWLLLFAWLHCKCTHFRGREMSLVSYVNIHLPRRSPKSWKFIAQLKFSFWIDLFPGSALRVHGKIVFQSQCLCVELWWNPTTSIEEVKSVTTRSYDQLFWCACKVLR